MATIDEVQAHLDLYCATGSKTALQTAFGLLGKLVKQEEEEKVYE